VPHLAAFLREHLPTERRASSHTCDTYAYCFQLLACFAARRLGIKPRQLEVEHLDVRLVLAFLEHLERDRSNSARPTPGWPPAMPSSDSWNIDLRPVSTSLARSTPLR
jgi:hypothetical protein